MTADMYLCRIQTKTKGAGLPKNSSPLGSGNPDLPFFAANSILDRSVLATEILGNWTPAVRQTDPRRLHFPTSLPA